MSAAVANDSFFLSALQPNSSVTTYAVPSDHQLGHGGSVSDEAAKVKRVQQQVQMRLAERSSGSLPRTSTHQYGTAELNGSSTLRYHTYNPGFSSISLAHIASRTKPVARVSQYSSWSRPAPAPPLHPSPTARLVGSMYGPAVKLLPRLGQRTLPTAAAAAAAAVPRGQPRGRDAAAGGHDPAPASRLHPAGAQRGGSPGLHAYYSRARAGGGGGVAGVARTNPFAPMHRDP
ncbi:hypothetical protein AALO_G00269530 [Alosa alosa]|uniref:Uncharacterized protein n=1 Tax=Alosa alosa TaxID=278164 RepID=A0AAV6FLY4_9TELE|nr:hypothetical protein AALO_G00269530 [Alosa alosa]